MAERKTVKNKASVSDFINNVENETRRKDAKVLAKMMRKVSGKSAKMWGPSIVGFGTRYYKLASGKEESICKIGFSPRKTSLSFYLNKFPGKDALLKKLGKYKTSKACLYINKLDDVDLNVLEKIIQGAWKQPDDGKGC